MILSFSGAGDFKAFRTENRENQDISMEADKQATELARLALEADCPKIYFNGFTTSVGAGDVVIALQCNGKPVAVLNASYTLAKTLSVFLANAIGKLEKATGNAIMTTEDIAKGLSAIKTEPGGQS
jgi:hypothetical protein